LSIAPKVKLQYFRFLQRHQSRNTEVVVIISLLSLELPPSDRLHLPPVCVINCRHLTAPTPLAHTPHCPVGPCGFWIRSVARWRAACCVRGTTETRKASPTATFSPPTRSQTFSFLRSWSATPQNPRFPMQRPKKDCNPQLRS